VAATQAGPVFAVNGNVRNEAERSAHLDADLDDLAIEGEANGVLGADGEIDLTFGACPIAGPDAALGCRARAAPRRPPTAST
jgi:hypothetical protein